MRPCEIADSRVALLGFGAEGRATLDALRRAGAWGDLCVLSDAPSSEAAALGLPSLIGDEAVARARAVNIVIKSPATRTGLPYLGSTPGR